MSTESRIAVKLKRNLAACAVFLVLMASVLYWLSSGEPEKLLGKQRMLAELKKEQEVERDLSAGFRVEPLVDAEYALRLLPDLAAAQESIDVLMFEIKLGKNPNNPANQLVGELVSARRRGVTVRVRLEQSELDKSLTAINRRTAEFLKAEGIYPDFDLPGVETHAKAVLIDGRILYVGNHNWSDAALRENHEVSLRVESERPISAMRRYFDKFDAGLKKSRMSALFHLGLPTAWADEILDVVFLHNEEYLAVLQESLRAARHRVEIEMYLIRPGTSEGHPVTSIVETLGAVRKRGVQVGVILDEHFKQDNQKAKERLKRAGVWDVKFDEPDVTNHRKMVIIDDEIVIVGSQNWTLSALAASNESAIYVKDRTLALGLKKKLEFSRRPR